MEVVRPALLIQHALASIAKFMDHANNVPHTEIARFALDTHSNHAVRDILHAQFVLQIIHANIVQDILHAQFVEHIISANTATDTPMEKVHLAAAVHIIHIIVIVQTSIK